MPLHRNPWRVALFAAALVCYALPAGAVRPPCDACRESRSSTGSEAAAEGARPGEAVAEVPATRFRRNGATSGKAALFPFKDGDAVLGAAKDLCFLAAVALPDGVTVTKFQLAFDGAPAATVFAGLHENRLRDGANTLMAEWFTLGAASGHRKLAETAIFSPDVDTAENSYYIDLCFRGDPGDTAGKLDAARVFYE